ncbi:MAG: DUF4012 domain-containing protein [Patescibacteria group bacterium]|nr:DUF4012 domain-containing protein [Patescibacteria group bacterium]
MARIEEQITMTKKKRQQSWKFWVAFWGISILFLIGWTAFWQYKHHGLIGMIGFIKPVVKVLPVTNQQKEELSVIFEIIPLIAGEEEKTFLILFQNNHELRPGGGFIGTFGILKVKNNSVTFVDTHDTTVFDNVVETGIEPPFPMSKTLTIKDWELRDSNWSADFPTNAKKADFFYHLQGGQEELDGVIAVSTEILSSFLEVTGPITIERYEGEYNSENAISKLQFQVEQGYLEQDIDIDKRKYIIKDMAREILKKAQEMSISKKKKLVEKIEQHLNEKDVMIFFENQELQDQISYLNWSGEVKNTEKDYLMIVDANLAAYKSDQVMRRSFKYYVDFNRERPRAKLAITYSHKGSVRDWQITDYQTYLRVFVSENSWLVDSRELSDVKFGKENGKKYFGSLIRVPLGKSKTVEFIYDLPENFTEDDYGLLIQKQSGTKNPKGMILITRKNKEAEKHEIQLNMDWELE